MGRTTLSQTAPAITSQGASGAAPSRRGRSGSKNSNSGMSTHQAITPPAVLMAASRGPMM